MRVALLALAVVLVLADSSVVTLGLPAVLTDFDASPEGVSWVLTGYNLMLALAAVPAALLLLRSTSASAVATAGLIVFALASLVCALAPGLGVLVAARCVQGLGGAAVACAALVLLGSATGDKARGAAIWGAAGAIGAALGPAVGGLLTEAFSWEAIFAVQVPLALACLLAVRELAAPPNPRTSLSAPPEGHPATFGAAGAGAVAEQGRRLWEPQAEPDGPRWRRDTPAERAEGRWSRPEPEPVAPAAPAAATRPDVRSLAALAFLGAGLTAALFLLVLLLIAGWRRDPIEAALAVSFMPIAALLASRVHAGLDSRTRGAAGAILVAGGLAALGLLPEASIAWTIAPQILIGIGLGMSLGPLTEHALEGREPQALHGGWTLAARHAGVVAALALLTPIFTADLEREEDRAQESVVALVLDAPISPGTKLALGLELAERLDAVAGEVPEVGPAFDAAQPRADEAAAYARLEADVDEELDRAATKAFERSFLIGAALAALALVPLLIPAGARARA